VTPEAPSRLDNFRTLRYANLDGGFATVFGTLVGGTFLVGLIRWLEGSDRWIGLLTAVPSFLGLLQIPGAIWGRSHAGFRGFVLPGGLIWRFLYLPFLAVPFLPIDNQARLVVVFVCVTLASAAVQIVSPIYNDWLAEMVPTNSRGWYFGRRNAILTVFGAAGGLVGAMLLDVFKGQGQYAIGFAVVFGLGLVCAAISMVFYLKMRDVPRQNPMAVSLASGIAQLRTPLVDRNFRKVLVFFVLFVGAQTFGGNLFSAFALETLDMPFTVLQLSSISIAVATVISAPLWGYLADRYGNKPILAILGVGLFLTPAMWLFMHPGADFANAAILVAGHLFSGFIWGGIGVCQFNLLLATADARDRANYIGLGLAVQALVGAVSPLLGAELMFHLRQAIGAEMAYKAVFLTTMGLRLAAVFFLSPVREGGSISLRSTLRDLRSVTPRGYVAFRQISHASDVATRETAMQDAASQNMSLAAEEIVKALHDPAPRIRRQAAAALARLGDARAVEGLVHQLEEHPDLVEEETIEALGDIGRPEAVDVLTRYLNDPRAILRRAAAKALGKIGHASAIAPLVEAAGRLEDPDLRRASLQALRMLGALEGEAVITEALADPRPSIRVAAAEAVAELGLRGAADALRRSLSMYSDEGASEVAYALGAVGERDDVPMILAHALACRSIITRRRCLLGVARMFGVEAQAYRLMRMEGMSRDGALIETMAAAMRRDRRLEVALDRYSAGDEPGALKLIAEAHPELADLAARPVEELFLVAGCEVARED
jgi:MFS family permease